MKNFTLSVIALTACCASALASTIPQLNLISLHLDKKLYNENYVIDADACEYVTGYCNDQLPGTIHDHESRHFDTGWVNWKPGWQPIPKHYKVVSYHLSVRHPNSGSDIIACGSDHPVPANARHISLKVFKLFGQMHCAIIG